MLIKGFQLSLLKLKVDSIERSRMFLNGLREAVSWTFSRFLSPFCSLGKVAQESLYGNSASKISNNILVLKNV